jgi:hypothetical protein
MNSKNVDQALARIYSLKCLKKLMDIDSMFSNLSILLSAHPLRGKMAGP